MNAQATYTVVIHHQGETARLDCASYEEALNVRRAFITYGKYQDEIEIIANEQAN